MAIKLTEKQIKDGWQIVKFGEIAKNISKRVEPSETDLEVYVGLEHLDPQSLRITRRGVPADVKGQKLRVRPGQIIFGKRRAYQKKLAVADFDGICSAHAMVLEEVVGKIIPGLLPFFMQSDMFMDRAVAISEGSLSPTIKWKTLETQEFPLPPIERQKEILEVLEKLEDAEEKTVSCLNSSLCALRRLADYACNNDRGKDPLPEFTRYRLKDVCKSNTKSLGTKTDPGYQFSYVDISSCTYPGQLTSLEKLTFKGAPSRAKRVVKDGDTLVSTVRPNHQATCYFENAEDVIGSTGFTVVTPNDKAYSKWVFYCTLTKQFVHNLSNLMVGTSFPAVSDDDIMVQHVDFPEKTILPVWEDAFNRIYKSYNALKLKQERFSTFRSLLMQHLLLPNDGGVQ
jgi:type I restriction enzyme, S subunit